MFDIYRFGDLIVTVNYIEEASEFIGHFVALGDKENEYAIYNGETAVDYDIDYFNKGFIEAVEANEEEEEGEDSFWDIFI